MNPPRRGEIWRTDLDPTQGDEIGKVRPVVIVNRNSYGRLALRVVVPITGWNPAFAAFPWMVPIAPSSTNGLTKPSAADTFQICSLSEGRFLSKIGDLGVHEVETIASAISLMVTETTE